MSAVTQILDQFKTELGYISVANQYENNSKRVIEGMVDMTKHNDFDVICYYPGNRKPSGRNYSNNQPAQWELELYVHIIFKAPKGDLVRKGESWIEDFNKWFYRSSSVTANKWFMLDHESSSLASIVEWSSGSLDEIQRFADWEKDIAQAVFKITINYSLN